MVLFVLVGVRVRFAWHGMGSEVMGVLEPGRLAKPMPRDY